MRAEIGQWPSCTHGQRRRAIITRGLCEFALYRCCTQLSWPIAKATAVHTVGNVARVWNRPSGDSSSDSSNAARMKLVVHLALHLANFCTGLLELELELRHRNLLRWPMLCGCSSTSGLVHLYSRPTRS